LLVEPPVYDDCTSRNKKQIALRQSGSNGKELMMNRDSLPMVKYFFLVLVISIVLPACGKSIDSLKEDGDIQGLVTILEDPQEKRTTRTEAAWALSEIGGPSVVEPLIRYMQECRETTEKTTPATNKEWGDTVDAIAPLVSIMGRMGDQRAVDPLIDMLENEWGHDSAVQALGKLGDPRAIPPLINTIDHGTNQFTDLAERTDTHRSVVLALVANATSETFDALSQWLPVFYGEKAPCSKYRLTMDALMAMQDPRMENILLSEMRSYRGECKEDLASYVTDFYKNDPAGLLSLLKTDTSGAIAKFYYSLTPKPQPIEVDFRSIYEYPMNTEVTITGRVSVGSAVVCDPDCAVELYDPSNKKEYIVIYLRLRSQMASLPNAYSEKDFKVFLNNGDSVGNNSLIRITGTICQAYAHYQICDITEIENGK
jgi:PBS lyase HEAT-like repeat